MARGRILVSGTSVAGPTVAYWLHRYGFDVTVVERAPAMERGGHAVDLFGPAVEIARRMGVLPRIEAARTGIDQVSVVRPGKAPVTVATSQVSATITDAHVEIMRGDLAGILYEATRDKVAYRFGDSIQSLRDTGTEVAVTFDSGETATFDLVVGADGLHSNVRRLVFGPETRFLRHLGGYLAIFTVPNFLQLDGRMVVYHGLGRLAVAYPPHDGGDARAAILLRTDTPLTYDYRDVDQQRRLLRAALAGEGWEVPRLLDWADQAEDFYFDAISQVLMSTWSRGRVTLVGDAGYSPAPAVGGGTTLAMIGAYLLAGELHAAGGDHHAGLARYEDAIRDTVIRSRAIAPTMMKTLIPRTRRQIWLTVQATRLLPYLPSRLLRGASAIGSGLARTLRAVTLPDYETPLPTRR